MLHLATFCTKTPYFFFKRSDKKRFFHQSVKPRVTRFFFHLFPIAGSQKKHRYMLCHQGPDLPCRFKSIYPGHFPVQQNHIILSALICHTLYFLQCFLSAVSDIRAYTDVLHPYLNITAHRLIIIYGKDM